MSGGPLAEPRRIESAPARRARFRARLDAALARRAAVRALRGLLEARTADEAAAVAVTLGAVAWTGCLAFAAARGGIT
ncbi:hypothetical protein ACFYYB_17520 [Streptomyces sp. NPDC002886]|uniref:hypothetical protein n=1 Tax=Streptomyces sp. NPDC002886 TaxID=3364667 RepID=UPI0036CED07C